MPQQYAFIESFNGRLRDEFLNGEMFDSLDDARRKLALWRYDYNNVGPHSSLGNRTPAEARRTLEQFGGSAPGALAQTETEDYETNSRKLSLSMSKRRGVGQLANLSSQNLSFGDKCRQYDHNTFFKKDQI